MQKDDWCVGKSVCPKINSGTDVLLMMMMMMMMIMMMMMMMIMIMMIMMIMMIITSGGTSFAVSPSNLMEVIDIVAAGTKCSIPEREIE